MSRLNLKINGIDGLDPVVFVDGKKVRFKTNGFGNGVADIDVEDGAELRLVCWDTILSPLWLVWELLYFVVGVFGIFDFGRNAMKRSVEFSAILHPSEDAKAVVRLIRSQGEGSPAAELECNFEAEVKKNEYGDFKTIKRRRLIARVVKIAAWVALICTAIAVVAQI